MKTFVMYALALNLACVIATPAHAQSHPQHSSIVGTWHFVRMESPGADGKPSSAPQPTGILIFTRDGHISLQLMYPLTSLSNELIHNGYEATFGTYNLNAAKHQLVYHIQGSATREKLIGKSEDFRYEFPDSRHLVILPPRPDQHWSVTWDRY